MLRVLTLSILICLFFVTAPLASDLLSGTVYNKFAISIYSKPNMDSQKLESLPIFSPITITEPGVDWLKVKTAIGSEGWVAVKWVADAQEVEALNAKKIKELEAKAKSIPTLNVAENLDVYEALVKLDPGNSNYQSRFNHYLAEEKKNFHFRKTRWGMSIPDVKSTEPLSVEREDANVLVYKTSVIGKDVFIIYVFIDDQLTRARYVLAESHSNKNDFIYEYKDFKEILIKKYGRPKRNESTWRNDLYKDDYSHWGMAISLGHLIYLSSWETYNTEIINILFGENHKIRCIVEYSSKNLKKFEKQAKEEKALVQCTS